MDAVQEYLNNCSAFSCEPSGEFLNALECKASVASVTCSRIQQFDAAIQAIAATLQYTTIEQFKIKGARLDTNTWQQLLGARSRLKQIKALHINECSVSNTGASSLEFFGQELGLLKASMLDLTGTQLAPQTLQKFLEGSFLTWEGVQQLHLEGTGLTDVGTAMVAACLESLGMACALKVLNLADNQIGDEGALALAQMLSGSASQSPTPIFTLNLHSNKISDIGGMALGKAIMKALVLQNINLSGNPVGNSTLLAIADCLRLNPGMLREVAIDTTNSGGSCTETGVLRVLQAAINSREMISLDLRGVKLTSFQAVDMLCELIRTTRTLRTIMVDLDNNSNAGKVTAELQNNHTLVNVVLGRVPQEAQDVIAAVVRANKAAQLMGTQEHSQAGNSWQPVLPSKTGRTSHGQYGLDATQSADIPPYGSTQDYDGDSIGMRPAVNNWTAGSLGPSTDRPHSWTTPLSPVAFTDQSPVSTNHPHHFSASFQPGAKPQAQNPHMHPNVPTRNSSGASVHSAASMDFDTMDVFCKHDYNKDGHLELFEMATALGDLGLLKGLTPRRLGSQIDEHTQALNIHHQGYISMDDFVSLARHLHQYRAQPEISRRIRNQLPTFPHGAESNTNLRRVFKLYCMSQQAHPDETQSPYDVLNMTCHQFRQLCEDALLVQPQGKFSLTAIYIVFAQCKPSKGRRLSWRNFLDTMAVLAHDTGKTFDEIISTVVALQYSSTVKVVSDAQAATKLYKQLQQLKSGVNKFTTICSTGPTSPSKQNEKPARQRMQYGRSRSANASPSRRPLSSSLTNSAHCTSPILAHFQPQSHASQTRGGNPAPFSSAKFRDDEPSVSPRGATKVVADAGPKAQLLWDSKKNSFERGLGKNIAGMAKRHELDALRKELSEMFTALDERLSHTESTQQYDLERAIAHTNMRMHAMDKQVQHTNLQMHRLGEVMQQLLAVQRELLAFRIKTGDVDNVGALANKVGHIQDAVVSIMDDLDTKPSAQQQSPPTVRSPTASLSSAPSTEQLRTLEAMVMDRQARVEGALMQVARKVDELDIRLRDEQESSIKALEAILATSANGSEQADATPSES